MSVDLCYPSIASNCFLWWFLTHTKWALMPDTPTWFGRLSEAIRQLEDLPLPWVDSGTLAFVLGIGRRRAQQILQPLVQQSLGRSSLAPKQDLIRHLRNLASGDVAIFEKQRQRRLAAFLEHMQNDLLSRPRVFVEAPNSIIDQEIERLPVGIQLSAGRIVIEGFTNHQEALHMILALVLAAGNDPDGFAQRIGP
jgi:hypothetical protein